MKNLENQILKNYYSFNLKHPTNFENYLKTKIVEADQKKQHYFKRFIFELLSKPKLLPAN